MDRYDGFTEFVASRQQALSRIAYLLTGDHHTAGPRALPSSGSRHAGHARRPDEVTHYAGGVVQQGRAAGHPHADASVAVSSALTATLINLRCYSMYCPGQVTLAAYVENSHCVELGATAQEVQSARCENGR